MRVRYFVKDTAKSCGHTKSSSSCNAYNKSQGAEQESELLTGQLGTYIPEEGVDLTQTKHSQSLQAEINENYLYYRLR